MDQRSTRITLEEGADASLCLTAGTSRGGVAPGYDGVVYMLGQKKNNIEIAVGDVCYVKIRMMRE